MAETELEAQASSGQAGRRPRELLTQGLLVALLASLGLASALGLVGQAMGDLGNDGSRLLGSLVIIAMFLSFGLLAVVRMEGFVRTLLGIAGLAASAIALALSVWAVWTEPSEPFVRPLGTALISAGALAYTSLMLLVPWSHRAVSVLVALSLACLVALSVAALVLLWGNIPNTDVIARVMSALAILTVFGSLASPILNRLLKR